MARSEQQPLTDRIHELTDVELAILLALIAEENCLIDTEASALDDLESEIRLVSLIEWLSAQRDGLIAT